MDSVALSPVPAASLPEAVTTEAALSIEGLVVRRGGRRVVDGVGLELVPGAAVALLGPNGAGKTTLFEAIAGLIPVHGGRVRLFGQAVDRWPLDRRARWGLGYLPQEPSVFRRSTVRQNVSAVLELRVPRAERSNRLEALLERFGLAGIAEVRADDLSGGERRRTELARLWASGPRCLLLDEPFAGLDPRSADELQLHLRGLIEEGHPVLFSDHAVERALDLCHRACVIAGGRLVVEGPPDEVRASEAAQRVYFGQGFIGQSRNPVGALVKHGSGQNSF